MPTLFNNVFDSVTRVDGDDFTTANSGDTGNGDAMTVTVGTGSTVKHDAADAQSGFGVKTTLPGTSPLATWIGKTDLGATTAETWFRFYIKKNFDNVANPGVQAGTWFDLFRVVQSDGSTRCAVVRLSTADVVGFQNAADTSLGINGPVLGTGLVRIELRVIPLATNGTLEWRIYKTDPNAAIGSYDATNISTTAALGATIGGFRAGVVSTPANMIGLSWTYDAMAISTDGWIGPATTPPPAGPAPNLFTMRSNMRFG